MRRLTLLGAFGVVLLLLGAGCGIPAASDVRVDGKVGAATEAGVVDGPGSEPPTRTASGSLNEVFVRNFLSAAAGERTGRTSGSRRSSPRRTNPACRTRRAARSR